MMVMRGDVVSPELEDQFSHGAWGQLSCCSVQQGAGPGPVRDDDGSAWPLDFNKHDSYESPPPHCNMGHGHHHRPQMQQERDSRHAGVTLLILAFLPPSPIPCQ